MIFNYLRVAVTRSWNITKEVKKAVTVLLNNMEEKNWPEYSQIHRFAYTEKKF